MFMRLKVNEPKCKDTPTQKKNKAIKLSIVNSIWHKKGLRSKRESCCTCTQIQTCFSKGILEEKNAIEEQPSATLL